MQLRNAPKIHGIGIHRVIEPQETLRRAQKVMHRVGVTRLADITGLDRIGIPIYSAVVPRSGDVVSVYNGKGVTKLEAKVGALMEAIERHASLAVENDQLHYGSYKDLRRRHRVLDPASLGFERDPNCTEDTELPWVEGFDLLAQTPMLVPIELAGFNVIGKYGNPCYVQTTTNGLASGNTLEEAICHALCELIERDAWALASLSIRHLRDIASPSRQPSAEHYPTIDLTDARGTIRKLVRAFERAALVPVVKDITSDLGIATVYCSVAENVGPGLAMAHFGLGTHPDANVAMVRALTEAAQSRAVDIHGVREDISSADEVSHRFSIHSRRVSQINWRSWYHASSFTKRPLSQVRSYEHVDILGDVKLMLERIRAAGVQHVIVCELTRPDVAMPVVRVVAPGLESTDLRQTGWRGLVHILATA